MVRSGRGRLPAGVLWSHVAGGAAVAFAAGTVLLVVVRRRMDWSSTASARGPSDEGDEPFIPW